MRRFFLIPWLFFGVGATLAQDDVHLKVQSRGFQRIVIDVPPFTSDRQGDIPQRLRERVQNDLDLSGFFRVADLSTPAPTARLTAQVSIQGQTITLQAGLVDVAQSFALWGQTYEAPLMEIRSLAHALVDDVTLTLTGYVGIAQTRIAYVHAQGEAKEVAVVDYDGYGPRRLTRSGVINLSPAWSADAGFLIYTSFATGHPDLQLLRLSDGRTSNFTRYGQLHAGPEWSPAGEVIAFSLSQNGNADIVTLGIPPKKLSRLTHGPAIESEPSWSPSGRELAFTSGRSGSPQVYIMEADGGNVRRLTYEGRYNASPAWSPQGDLIAYVSREDDGFRIYTIDVTGENRRRLTRGAGNHENPSWSPNGMWLAFASNQGGAWDIYVIHKEGWGLRRVTATGGNTTPAWSPVPKDR